jgi:hypothetical protein
MIDEQRLGIEPESALATVPPAFFGWREEVLRALLDFVGAA